MNQEMRALVDNFVTDLANIWRRAALEAMTGASGASDASSDTGNGNQRKRSSANGDMFTERPSRKPRQVKGGKRAPELLEQVSTSFAEFVAKNPGLRIEQINKQLGTTTKDLRLPIRKLIEDGVIKAKGLLRSTTYFAK